MLLFWSSLLSRGVSSFGYRAAWQSIFSYVYFEVITLGCFCLSDGYAVTLIHPLSVRVCVLHCRNRLPVVSCSGLAFISTFLSWSIFFISLAHFLPFTHIPRLSIPAFYAAFPACLTGISPSTPSPWPLPVLFDINIVSGWPDGVGFRCGAVASSALLLPGYKQVSCGPWWPITVAHMLIEKIRQPQFLPFLPLPCTVLHALWEMGSKNIDISLILEFKACCS